MNKQCTEPEGVESKPVNAGKKIKVNGHTFESCGLAARHIADGELGRGNKRNKDTISKELRRFLRNPRDDWNMYGEYLIELP